MGSAAQVQPTRPSVWLFGEVGGVQVWAAIGHPSVRASVLIGQGAPVVVLNRAVVGTPAEFCALNWAFGEIAAGRRGFHVLRA